MARWLTMGDPRVRPYHRGFLTAREAVRFGCLVRPISRAQRTVYWFVYGEHFDPYPQPLNCRCVFEKWQEHP